MFKMIKKTRMISDFLNSYTKIMNKADETTTAYYFTSPVDKKG